MEVGAFNMLRSEFSENGPLNIPEFGSVTTEAGFRALLGMDSYHNVRSGTKYPAVLLTTGINDPRVAPWEVGKMAARLQASTTSGKPVLLRVDYDAGHGFGSTKTQNLEEHADEMAFLFWQLGARTTSSAGTPR
jgi:prolyl oligopeptidase